MDPTNLHVSKCSFGYLGTTLFIFHILSYLQSIDISGFQVSVVEKLSAFPQMSKIGIPCILSDVENSRYG